MDAIPGSGLLQWADRGGEGESLDMCKDSTTFVC